MNNMKLLLLFVGILTLFDQIILINGSDEANYEDLVRAEQESTTRSTTAIEPLSEAKAKERACKCKRKCKKPCCKSEHIRVDWPIYRSIEIVYERSWNKLPWKKHSLEVIIDLDVNVKINQTTGLFLIFRRIREFSINLQVKREVRRYERESKLKIIRLEKRLTNCMEKDLKLKREASWKLSFNYFIHFWSVTWRWVRVSWERHLHLSYEQETHAWWRAVQTGKGWISTNEEWRFFMHWSTANVFSWHIHKQVERTWYLETRGILGGAGYFGYLVVKSWEFGLNTHIGFVLGLYRGDQGHCPGARIGKGGGKSSWEISWNRTREWELTWNKTKDWQVDRGENGQKLIGWNRETQWQVNWDKVNQTELTWERNKDWEVEWHKDRSVKLTWDKSKEWELEAVANKNKDFAWNIQRKEHKDYLTAGFTKVPIERKRYKEGKKAYVIIKRPSHNVNEYRKNAIILPQFEQEKQKKHVVVITS